MENYLLVAGGGHGGWCWSRVTAVLERNGHRAIAPTLQGVGERMHEADPATGLNSHVDEIVNLIERLDLDELILVGHSYAGMVVTGVADRMAPRIRELVYLDAAIPMDGEALVDTSPGISLIAGADMKCIDGVEFVLWPTPGLISFFGILSDEDRAFVEGRLTPHPWKAFVEPLRLHNPDGVAALPRTIVNCTDTLARRPPEIAQRWHSADRVWEIDTGHDLMITEPDAVAAMLLKLARSGASHSHQLSPSV